MRAIRDWLTAEWLQVRGFTIRRLHGIAALVAIVIALVIGLLIGFAAGFHYPYRTLPPPPVPPGQTQPSCDNPHNLNHTHGECLPKPVAPSTTPTTPPSGATTQNVSFQRVLSITRSTYGPDLSNNDPVTSWSAWALIAARDSWAIFKVNESTGFQDRYAKPQADAAKAHGLVVGGYDFLHVCLVDPSAEARVFVALLKADGLTGPGTYPGTGDAEYGGSGCNVRSWIYSWASTVNTLTGRWPMFYTGAWWWDPHVGCWWPNPSLAWVSGYTGSLSRVPRPCGQGHIDIWQFTDAGFNGASSGDLSTWLDGPSAFQTATNAGPPPDPYAIYPLTVFNLAAGQKGSEHKTVSLWDKAGCENPVRRAVCRSTLWHEKLERDRDSWVAHHVFAHGHWTGVSTPRWGSDHLGARVQGLQHRITAPPGRRCSVQSCG